MDNFRIIFSSAGRGGGLPSRPPELPDLLIFPALPLNEWQISLRGTRAEESGVGPDRLWWPIMYNNVKDLG